MKPKRNRRCGKHLKASITNIVTDVATSPVSASEFNGHSDVTPNKAQSNKDANQDSKPQTPVASPLVPPREASPTIHETSTSVTGSDSESEVDLLSCDNVSYEKRGDTRRVSHHDSISDKHGWTPVVGRRKKKISLPTFVLR